jgi:hypothetical protein
MRAMARALATPALCAVSGLGEVADDPGVLDRAPRAHGSAAAARNRRGQRDDAVRLATVAAQHGRWPALADMPDNAATLDGVVESSEAVFEAKFMLP